MEFNNRSTIYLDAEVCRIARISFSTDTKSIKKSTKERRSYNRKQSGTLLRSTVYNFSTIYCLIKFLFFLLCYATIVFVYGE